MRIEHGVPIPPPRKGPGGGRPRSAATIAATNLKPGECLVCDTYAEYQTVRSRMQRIGRKFIGKKTRDGWRVWVLE
jgi:hypothetical protein